MKPLCVVEGERIGDQRCYDEAGYRRQKKRKAGGTWSFFDCKVTEAEDDGKHKLPASPPFLPLQRSSEKPEPTLVLDLDNTLVSCLLDHHGCDPGANVWSYFVAKRPGVDAFLRKMVKHYEVVLWTGSKKQYADSVLKVFEEDVFSYRICKVDKKLADLGRDLSKVVMVDDCRRGRCPETDNLIVIAHYVHDGRHEDDTKLEGVADILMKLASVEDVRPELIRLRQDGVLDKIAACPHACKRRG